MRSTYDILDSLFYLKFRIIEYIIIDKVTMRRNISYALADVHTKRRCGYDTEYQMTYTKSRQQLKQPSYNLKLVVC